MRAIGEEGARSTREFVMSAGHGSRQVQSRSAPSDGNLLDESAVRKILFVDDNVALAENLAEIAESSGYQTAIAASGEAAVDLVAGGDIFGIVTDFRLPGLDGIELIELVRRSGSGIPAAIITAYADETLVERAKLIGVRGLLSKPIHLPQLMRLIGEFDEG